MPWPIIVVAVLIIVGLLYVILRRFGGQRQTEDKVRDAVAASAARRFNVTVDEILRAIASSDATSVLRRRIKDEMVQCRATFSRSARGSVVMTVMIYWRDGQETKVEQEQVWDQLPDDVRAHIIRTGQPYSYTWQLPVSVS